MALIKCPECTHEVSDSINQCPHCGYDFEQCRKEAAKAVKKQRKKERLKKAKGFIIAGIIVILLAPVLIGLYFYLWAPKTASWICKHEYVEATCTTPQTCKRCGTVVGEPIGHSWVDATCTEAMYCATCGEENGNPNGHEWEKATCTEAKKCKVCGVEEGEPLGHDFSAATCTEKKKCKRCGYKEGKALGHNVKDYICTRCHKTILDNPRKDWANILDISNEKYRINSVGGVDLNLTFKNKSQTKTIKYINITLSFFNSVYDDVYNDIGGGSTAELGYTGPLAPGKSTGQINASAVFYNSTVVGWTYEKIEIVYTDGTKISVSGNDAKYASVKSR